MNPLALAALSCAGIGSTLVQLRLRRRLSAELPSPISSALALGFVLATFLAVVPLFGRAFRSFDVGLIAGGLAPWIWLYFFRDLDRRAAARFAPDPRLLAALALVAIVYAYLAWRYQMHDELAIFGHKSMVEQLRHGVYPIRLPPLPFQEARYHVGFDLLAGALARALGVSSDLAIDAVTVGMAVFLSLTAAALVTDLGAPGRAPFAAVAIHFGAGLAWLLLAGVEGRHPRCLIQYHHPSCGVELFPTPLLNVFQHPVSVGVPLFFLWVLVARRIFEGRRIALVYAAVLLPALAIGQVVYFSLGACAALVAAGWTWLRPPPGFDRARARTGLLWIAAALACALIVARISGGMFAPMPALEAGLVGFRPRPGYPPDVSLTGIVYALTVNLGIGFLLFPVFVRRVLVQRSFALTLLVAFATGGILAAQLLTYSRSWDIVKFPSASAFVLTLLYVATIEPQLLALCQRSSASLRSFGRAALASGRVLLLGSGVLAAVFLVRPLEGELTLYDTKRFENDPQVTRAIEWLWRHDYRPEELVFCQSNIAQYLSIFGGLAVYGHDYDLWALGLDKKLLDQREQLAQRIRQRMAAEDLAALGVRWLVFSEEELDNLGADARERLLHAPDLELQAVLVAPDARRMRKIWRVAGP